MFCFKFVLKTALTKIAHFAVMYFRGLRGAVVAPMVPALLLMKIRQSIRTLLHERGDTVNLSCKVTKIV